VRECALYVEEDKQIQNNLKRAGNGLPAIEALFLKYVGFPIVKTIVLITERIKVSSCIRVMIFSNPTYSAALIPFHFVNERAKDASAGNI